MVILAWAMIVYAVMAEMVVSRHQETGLIQVLTLTLQSVHNQLYFLLPTLGIAWLLVFQRPTHHELFLLVNSHHLSRFLAINVLQMLGIILMGTVISCGLALMTRGNLIVIGSINLPLEATLLTLHFAGVALYLDVLAVLTIIFNKVAAAGLVFTAILGDYLVLQGPASFFMVIFLG
ncbi:hypothetical protein L248_0221 [Schleiferilactobacillus shenzhenensis LY-73]|uniref:Uncharacterized protein n=2 Tax=Schleiferilactobacillus shenzhenensis TaxID=1231337 RepID=U4TZ02_9LACO|nr:hypothetical protein L248_0221 [Schleiferilactobacillus shenzhenensis LY-73]